MSERKLPFLGLTGYWPAGTPGWTLENQQNMRLLASINQLALASRATLPSAFNAAYMYLVPANQPNAGQLAVYDGGAWFYMVPQVGWNISVADELDGQGNPKWFNWTGSAWADGKAATGGYDDTLVQMRLQELEGEMQVVMNPPFQGTMIVPWADSRGAQNWNTNTTPPAVLARSPLYWAEMLSQRLRVNVDYMQAVSGDTIEQLVARIANDLPGNFGTKKPSEVPPCIAYVQIGTNSVNQGTPLATMLNQIDVVVTWLLARGHKVILLAEWPRGAQGSTDGQLSADNQKLLLAYHNGLLRIRRKNVWIVDVWPMVADPASVNAYPKANMLNPDNLHNSPGVAYITGKEIARVVREEMTLPRTKLTTSSNTDQFDAALQPRGCINTNPMLVKGAGGTVGTNATGEAPAGYTLSASAGLSVAGSFVTVTDPSGNPRPAFKMTVSGTPTSGNGYASLRQSGLIGKVAAGDILEANYELILDSAQQNMTGPGLMIDTGTAATRAHGGLALTGDNPMPTGLPVAEYGVARTPDLTLAALPSSLSFEMRLYFTTANVAAAGAVSILSSGLRKRPAS